MSSYTSPVRTAIAENSIHLLASVQVDGTLMSPQIICDTSAYDGRIFVPTQFVCRQMVGTPTASLMFTIGTTAPAYADIVGMTMITLGQFGAGNLVLNPIQFYSSAQTPIYLNPTAVFIGSATMYVDTIGYFIQ